MPKKQAVWRSNLLDLGRLRGIARFSPCAQKAVLAHLRRKLKCGFIGVVGLERLHRPGAAGTAIGRKPPLPTTTKTGMKRCIVGTF